MRRLCTLIFICLFCLSCSDDDTVNEVALPTVVVPRKIIQFTTGLHGESNSEEFLFSYDSQRRISSVDIVSVIGDHTLSNHLAFVYNDNNFVRKVIRTGDSGAQSIEYFYEEGKLHSTLTNAGYAESILYNTANGEYTCHLDPTLFYSFSFYENGDLKTEGMRQVGETDTSNIYTYDNQKKGAFFNVNGNYQFLGLLLGNVAMHGAFINITPKRPIVYKGKLDTPPQWVYTNTHDSQGFVTSTTTNSYIDEITFEYTAIY